MSQLLVSQSLPKRSKALNLHTSRVLYPLYCQKLVLKYGLLDWTFNLLKFLLHIKMKQNFFQVRINFLLLLD